MDTATEDAAIKLVGIHGKIWGGLDAKREFEFMLPRLRSQRSDFYSVGQAADKLAYVCKRIKDRESILDSSKRVYDISNAVYIGTGERIGALLRSLDCIRAVASAGKAGRKFKRTRNPRRDSLVNPVRSDDETRDPAHFEHPVVCTGLPTPGHADRFPSRYSGSS